MGTRWRACRASGTEALVERVELLRGTREFEPEVDEVELDGQTFYVANGVRRLPQSPPNQPGDHQRRVPADGRAPGAAHKLGFTYTRYADDLTFSGPKTADTGTRASACRVSIPKRTFRTRLDRQIHARPLRLRTCMAGSARDVPTLLARAQGIRREVSA